MLKAIVMVPVVALFSLGGCHTPVGQIQEVRRELARLSERVDYPYREIAALAFVEDLDLEQAFTINDSINNNLSVDLKHKVKILGAIIETIGKQENFPQADQDKYLAQVITAVEQIDNSYGQINEKVWLLTRVAKTYEEIENFPEADKYFAQAINTAKQMFDSSSGKVRRVTDIAETIGELENFPQRDKLLSQITTTAEEIEDLYFQTSALRAIAEVYSKLENFPQADKVLTKAISATEQLNDSISIYALENRVKALSAIAQTYGEIGDFTQANKYLTQAIIVARKIDNSPMFSLKAIIQTIGNLEYLPQADQLLAQSITAVDQINYSSGKALILEQILKTIVELENKSIPLLHNSNACMSSSVEKSWKNNFIGDKQNYLIASSECSSGNFFQADQLLTQIIAATEQIDDAHNKERVLKTIVKTIGELENLTQGDQHMAQIATTIEQINYDDFLNKAWEAWFLRDIVNTHGKLKNFSKADKYLAQAMSASDRIENQYSKANFLRAIVKTIGELENFPQADQYLEQVIATTSQIDDPYKVRVLITIAEYYNKQGKRMK
ncbi:MAG: tetratricopeptide repeat protein [Cyanobacteria bacterium P01_G01_bin.39]